MKRLRLGGIVVVLMHWAGPALAYMDPGTSGSMYGLLAPVISFFLLCLGFLFQPLKRLWSSLKAKFSSKRDA